jgi:hypothetical protein
MTKLIVAFRNFAKAPTNDNIPTKCICVFLCGTHNSDFITKINCVYCAVRIESLNIIHVISTFNVLL